MASAFQSNAFQDDAFQTSAAAPAHEYDTGLSKPQRTILREAIARRLAPLLKTANGYLQAIVQIPKPVRNAESEDDQAMLFHFFNGRAPSVAISLGRRSSEESGSLATESMSTIDVHIYVASSHGRDLVNGRLAGDVVATSNPTLDPGIETMLEHVEQLLQGHTPRDAGGDEIPTLHELRGADEDEVGTAADLSVWEQRYTCQVERVINPARAITQLVTEIQGRNTGARLALVPAGADPLAPLITLSTLSPPEDS